MRVENEDEQQLIVADEELSSLEDVVRVLPTAQYLNVAFNCIRCLSELDKMTELRSLDISHNAVESLQEVASLPKLLVLKCSSNHITDLSWVAGLTCLEELWIRDNRVESAQLAHLQQLTALQTLVIHPNPCTKRDDYVADVRSVVSCGSLAILKLLPWLQRVDTVVVTVELREEARHAEERGDLDSGATDCSLFSLSGRSEGTRPNEDNPENTPPMPKPAKSKKQMSAEDFMRAFPVQDFIPLDSGGEDVPDNQLRSSENGAPQPKTAAAAVSVPETVDNQHDMANAEDIFASNGNLLQSDNGAQERQSSPKVELEPKPLGISALLDSVLTLPTFDNDSFLKKKKPQSQLPGTGKSKQRTKAKSAAVPQSGRPDSTLPFHQDEEYIVAYPNSTVTAIQVRCDGSAIARWPSGSVAISVDFETSADRSGYRVYAAHKDGQLALSFDPAGVGFLNAYPSGKTLLSTTFDGGGLLFDINTGGILRRWDSQGRLRDGSCQSADSLGEESDGSLLCRLSEYLSARVHLAHPQPTQPESRRNPIKLCMYFAGAPGIRHVFVNSANRAEPSNSDACDYALGKASSKEDMARAAKAKPPPVEHIDLLSSIRAAVAGL
ncbi:hypothetical protein PHYPSEUDO_010401 [Phytophthora pseudosyringae]|uniref:Uncharacterized protein n=1 Tax=Phytophthora pseudosyringae TaxID=221518 RepID=A0A8T1VFI3_9STRA|nr:hypothetical protein PHYPSEUDO_010401 [Phytophthora pseudosyringae]